MRFGGDLVLVAYVWLVWVVCYWLCVSLGGLMVY